MKKNLLSVLFLFFGVGLVINFFPILSLRLVGLVNVRAFKKHPLDFIDRVIWQADGFSKGNFNQPWLCSNPFSGSCLLAKATTKDSAGNSYTIVPLEILPVDSGAPSKQMLGIFRLTAQESKMNLPSITTIGVIDLSLPSGPILTHTKPLPSRLLDLFSATKSKSVTFPVPFFVMRHFPDRETAFLAFTFYHPKNASLECMDFAHLKWSGSSIVTLESPENIPYDLKSISCTAPNKCNSDLWCPQTAARKCGRPQPCKMQSPENPQISM